MQTKRTEVGRVSLWEAKTNILDSSGKTKAFIHFLRVSETQLSKE